MKRMLFNATQAEELRVAIVDGQKLIDLDIESAAKEERKSNIYKAVITRIEPSLEAAFVDYGADRHGFLPFKEISRSYFQPGADAKASIKEALKEGQELIVQVEKDERGNKGAALTTYISLAGRYLVLMPNNPRAGGISRRVEGDDRTELREALSQLELPEGMGLIIRTAGVGKSAEELQWDLDYLLKLWEAVETAAKEKPAPFLIYQDNDVIIRAIRDYFGKDVGEILIDSEAVYQHAQRFMQQVMPQSQNKVKLYQGGSPLFSRYQIESQIESAFSHNVDLPSGGALVIDHTEALVSIDINSARATKGADIEETALNTNLEAADEIARQLRIRDIGGLVVVDFIDMTPARNQREVENRLRDALKQDRARVQVGRISRFGLLEMSRQRLRPSLGESSLRVCPTCNGEGSIRGPSSLALAVLRLIEEEAMKDHTGTVLAKLPIDTGIYLLNEKRETINELERQHGLRVVVVPDPNLFGNAYSVERIREDDTEHDSVRSPSYELMSTRDLGRDLEESRARSHTSEPVVRDIMPPVAMPPPPPPPAAREPEAARVQPQEGVVTKVFRFLFGTGVPAQPVAAETPSPRAARPRSRTGSGNVQGGQSGAGGRRGSGRKSAPGSASSETRGGERRGPRAERNEPRGESRQDSRQDSRQGQPRQESGADNKGRDEQESARAEGAARGTDKSRDRSGDGARRQRPERRKPNAQRDESPVTVTTEGESATAGTTPTASSENETQAAGQTGSGRSGRSRRGRRRGRRGGADAQASGDAGNRDESGTGTAEQAAP
ncbi:MAG: Rne/Rng family ribonuclease, partial [Thauera sp.]|nr:Rne/Rng family ribonuclease [Thauera sp.]